jgi:hypothetical protein
VRVAIPSRFIGTWFGHSRDLVMKRDGSVQLEFRVYLSCTATRTTDCDRTRGNQIHDGGQVAAHVTQVINTTTMTITVTSTSAPDWLALGPVRVGYDRTHDAIAIFGGKLSGAPFCGNASPVGYCGA